MMTEQGKRPGHGCLFYGAIVGGILLSVMILAAFLGYRYARNLIDQFTDTSPIQMPAVRLSSEETRRLRERIDQFSKAVDTGKATEPLTLTSDEVNAWIASEPGTEAFRGHMYVAFEGDQIKAQVSIPAETVLRPLRGRYINGIGIFRTGLHDGALELYAESLSTKGRPLPENIMRHVRTQNFALQLNSDPNFSAAVSKLQNVQVKDGKLIIVPKNSR